MNGSTQDPSGNDMLAGPLGEAVAFIRAQPTPREAMRRAVAEAAGWAESPPPGALPSRRWKYAAVLATAAAMFVGICVFVSDAVQRRRAQLVAGGNPTTDLAKPDVPATSGPSIAGYYMPVPVTHPVVAEAAPVFVTIGPAEPVSLGARVAHADLLAGTDGTPWRLHVWDWSKSPASRVISVPGNWRRLAPAALSPDGTLLLNVNGDAVDLTSGQARQYGGFETAPGQRVERLRFAPDGKHVAALLSNSGDDDRVDGWLVRVIDLSTGEALSEFPSDDVDWFAWAAFAPDGTSVLHAAPDNVVTRRDLRTGAVLARYEPALEPHGAVGIAISPDGSYVAAGHYHGELFVWDVASGALVLRQPFLRPSGDADTFWQAKVLAFSPDGERLATTSSGRLQIVEVRTGRVVARADVALPSHVAHLRWSPDGGTITLVVASVVQTDSSGGRRPPRAVADVLPRVYHWDWEAGNAPVEWRGTPGAADPARGP